MESNNLLFAKMDNHIFPLRLHSSPLHCNFKINYVLNYLFFYHYWLEDEPCYGPPVRLPFVVISSRFLQKTTKATSVILSGLHPHFRLKYCGEEVFFIQATFHSNP